MVGRGELTDAAWAALAPLLPANGRRGKQWRDHRQVVDGTLWRLRTGAPWRDLPERYGPWRTCYDRFVRWRRDGTWDRLLQHVQTKSDAVGAVVWELSVDSTHIRAHQHAAGARHRPSRADEKGGIRHPADEALGRSRGGFTTKLHLSCDGRGRPLSLVLTAGQAHESTQVAAVMDGIRVRQPGRRARQRPNLLLADKGYSHEPIRRLLRRRQIGHIIPQRTDQRQRRQRRLGRPPLFDAVAYKRRNVVERRVARLKQFRALATRYEKRAANYRALVVLAAVLLWLRP